MTVDAWLQAHSNVRDAIYWQRPLGTNVSGGTYEHWSSTRKDELREAYSAAVNGEPTGLTDPAPNILQLGDDDYPTTALSRDRAWQLYLTHVAQSLAVEIKKRVSWSVTTYSSAQLAVLFDSREFFTWSESLDGYEIDEDRSGSVLPAAPDTSYRFLNDVQRIPALSLARLQVVLGKWIPWWIGPGKRRTSAGKYVNWRSSTCRSSSCSRTARTRRPASRMPTALSTTTSSRPTSRSRN